MNAAMAEAIKHGYAELFERNEYAHELSKPKLLELIGEVSGAEKGNRADDLTATTFLNLKEYADFDDLQDDEGDASVVPERVNLANQTSNTHHSANTGQSDVPLTLTYSINLILPETDNIKVFNAIFKSLNDNILKS